MKLLTKLMAGGGVAAFFFFSWVVMMLWNGIVAGHLGIGPTLSYLQVCGLWFLLIVVFAWTGIASMRITRAFSKWGRGRTVGERIARSIGSRHVGGDADDWDDIADTIERRVKKGIADWAGADPDLDWDDIGEQIERRIKERMREWAEKG
jgi:hypothetical protein